MKRKLRLTHEKLHLDEEYMLLQQKYMEFEKMVDALLNARYAARAQSHSSPSFAAPIQEIS